MGLHQSKKTIIGVAQASHWRQIVRMTVKLSALGILQGTLGTLIQIH